ncbi:unnamed protein product [Diatraea saccharalis]|uniref:Major facilitator superfamily (MFS) profile domain-containing protein n=1 Tax=Diatraea saccharalis TaxID=40085 RepID=A0A9P0FYU2_9NEOP|nr:unnamed protein product [Diatraea saccharalis]
MAKVLQSELSPTGKPLTVTEMSWVASSMPIAAVFGVSIYSYIADAYGRKVGVIAMAVPQALCWVIKLASSNTMALIIARIFAGIPAGGCFNLTPMYVKEISQNNTRGTLVSLTMMFSNIGLLAMYSMGAYLEYHIILWIALSISAISLALMWMAPESPAFLVKKGRIEEAAETIALLRGLHIDDKIVQTELEEMKNEEAHFVTMERITFMGIFKNKAWRRGFILCTTLLATLDLNGYFTIFTYAWSIMTEAGVTVNPELQTLSIPVLMIIGSLLSMICVEKLGRKFLLAGAYIISSLSICCLATILLLQKNEIVVPSWMPVVAIVTTVWAYAAGILPMTYVVMAEVFNFQVRAKLLGCIVTLGWFISFVQLSLYGTVSTLGLHTIFYFFATTNLFGALTSMLFLPETKGRSVEEIERMLLGIKEK